MFLHVGIWYYLEYFFLPLDLFLQTALIALKRTSVLRSIPWYILFIVAPIIGFGAYMMVGRAMFTRGVPITHRDPMPVQTLPEKHSATINTLLVSGSENYSSDSSIEYFNDGGSFFKKVFSDIRASKTSICIECYLIRSDRFSRSFIDLLKHKAEEGVKVRIIFDDYGYDGKDFTYVRTLRKAGAEVGIFHNMTKMMFTPLKNYRNHRKTFVIDSRIGYVGGYNIGEEYLGKGKFGKWNDSAVRIEGPQAQEILRSFADMWKYTTRQNISNDEGLFHITEASGNIPMMFVPGNPITPETNPILTQMCQMFRNAKEQITIETPYLNLPKSIRRILEERCRKGVRLNIVIPAIEDHPTVYWCNRWIAYKLIKAGAKVYEYTDGFLHGKVAVCDNDCCSVGTANYDMRSLTLNFECNMLIFSENVASQVGTDLKKALEHCREYTAEMFESRTAVQRIRTFLSLLFISQT